MQADYIATEGELVFLPGEVSKDIAIEVIDDDQYERDETFYVELFDAAFEMDVTGDGNIDVSGEGAGTVSHGTASIRLCTMH